MIQEYSEWTIGMSTDRLPAFAALAKAFGTYLQVGPEQYLADFGLSISVCSFVSRSSGKEPGRFRSVQLIAVCPIVPSHLCSI
jgi:hypothetical protein